MNIEKPTPPDGYELILGKDVPKPAPKELLKWIYVSVPHWTPSAYAGLDTPLKGSDLDEWYAVPVQKEKRCPLCGSACENSFSHWRCTRSICDWCDLCGGRCERNTANGCKGVPGPGGPPSALDTQVGGSHYQNYAIQPVDFIIKNGLGFAEGAVIKYVCRHEQKNGAEDLDKAIHYLQILKEMKYGKPT